jgi:hypothetical protein
MDIRQYWECDRKHSHATRGAAERMAAHIKLCTRGRSILSPYPCRYCGQWHLAHKTRRIPYATGGWDLTRMV